MASDCTIMLRVSVAWWVTPYIALTKFGLWIGMPLNVEIVLEDVLRGVIIEEVKNG
jgi:hypothetical protein